MTAAEFFTLMSDSAEDKEPRTRGGRLWNNIASLRAFTSSYAEKKLSDEVWLMCSAKTSSSNDECCAHRRGFINASLRPSKHLCQIISIDINTWIGDGAHQKHGLEHLLYAV